MKKKIKFDVDNTFKNKKDTVDVLREKTHYLPSLKVKLGDEQFDKKPEKPKNSRKRNKSKDKKEEKEPILKKVKFAEEESDLDEVNIYEELERETDPYEPYKILAMKVKPR